MGDYILAVNDQNVERMNATDFSVFLRTSAQNAYAQDSPLLLEVINEDSYQPPVVSDDARTR